MNLPEIVALTEEQARSLTNQVKSNAQALWANLLRLYEGGAHKSLGYSSWADYCAAEFDMSDASAYRLLQAARVVAELPMGSSLPTTERQVRELARVPDPELIPETWQAVVEEHGEQPTAQQVRQVVDQRFPKFMPDPKPGTAKATSFIPGPSRDPIDIEPAPARGEAQLTRYLSGADRPTDRLRHQFFQEIGHLNSIVRLDAASIPSVIDSDDFPGLERTIRDVREWLSKLEGAMKRNGFRVVG